MTTQSWRIKTLDTTTSTNDDVRAAAESGEAEGLVIIAKRQSAGRGRQGRVWESPEGNLYCSALLRPKNMPQSAGFYSFVAGLAIYDTVQTVLPKAVIAMKWPNDVLVEGKKISGVLLEVAGDALIVGIGLNIARSPEQALYPATSLADYAKPPMPSPEMLLDHLLERLGVWHDRMQTGGFSPIREAWLSHAKRGELTVRLPQETLLGRFAGLDETGRLRLKLEDGTERSIPTGDVVLPPKD